MVLCFRLARQREMKMQVFQKVTCSWKCPALFILFSYFPLVYIYWTKLWASLWDSYMYIICFYVIFLKPIEIKEDKYSTSWGSDKNLAMKAAETKWKKTKQTDQLEHILNVSYSKDVALFSPHFSIIVPWTSCVYDSAMCIFLITVHIITKELTHCQHI